MNEVLQRIEGLRELKKISKYKLCKDLKISQSTYNTWIYENRIPPANRIQLIADYFNIPIDYLMTGEIERKIDGANIIEEKAALVAKITKDSELLITIEEYYSLSEAMKQFVRNMVHDLTVRDIED